MDREEAIAFVRPAVEGVRGTWADFGAGTGTFTEALAVLLGAGGRVIAVERDRGALRSLRRLRDAGRTPAEIEVVAGDFESLETIALLRSVALDGALFANSLHYLPDPVPALARVAGVVRPGGRVVVIEYDRERGNRWVPYPLPVRRLVEVAREAGLGEPTIVSRRPSAYQGSMYCAVLERASDAGSRGEPGV